MALPVFYIFFRSRNLDFDHFNSDFNSIIPAPVLTVPVPVLTVPVPVSCQRFPVILQIKMSLCCRDTDTVGGRLSLFISVQPPL